jgi:hypothetical protein
MSGHSGGTVLTQKQLSIRSGRAFTKFIKGNHNRGAYGGVTRKGTPSQEGYPGRQDAQYACDNIKRAIMKGPGVGRWPA